MRSFYSFHFCKGGRDKISGRFAIRSMFFAVMKASPYMTLNCEVRLIPAPFPNAPAFYFRVASVSFICQHFESLSNVP